MPFSDGKLLAENKFKNSKYGESSKDLNISKSEGDSSEPEIESESDDKRDKYSKQQPPNERAQRIINNNQFTINSGVRQELSPNNANRGDLTNNSGGLQVSVATATTVDV